MKIYVAGPMRGIASYNFPAFDAAAKWLRRQGHQVISPAEMDRNVGFDETAHIPDEEFLRRAITRDMAAIAECDAIFLLRGWSKSKGANLELQMAKFLGLKVCYQAVPRIVGFSGRIGAGKDTACEALVEKGWIKVAFSDAVWAAVAALDPICDANCFRFHEYGQDIERTKRLNGEVRILAQRMGTEVGRNLIGENTWLDALERRFDTLPECPGVCVSGVRFDNEAEWIRQRGGYVIEVSRKDREGVDPSNGKHASETGLTRELIEIELRNDRGVTELHDRVREFVLGQASHNPREAVAV